MSKEIKSGKRTNTNDLIVTTGVILKKEEACVKSRFKFRLKYLQIITLFNRTCLQRQLSGLFLLNVSTALKGTHNYIFIY